MAKLFPATRTNVVDAAAKAHVTADIVARCIVDVTVTGERGSELDELYLQDFSPNILYLCDLGYNSYGLYWLVQQSDAFLLMRMKENANPTVVRIRHGVRAPKRSIGRKFKNLAFCKTQHSFDLDAEFYCREFGTKVTMRVVGLWNPDTGRYLPERHGHAAAQQVSRLHRGRFEQQQAGLQPRRPEPLGHRGGLPSIEAGFLV